MPGDGGHESGYRFGVTALVELRRHVPVAARAAFGDRTQHERPATGFGRNLRSEPHVEIGTDMTLGVCAREGMADRARIGEEHAAVLLLGVEVHSADTGACLAVAVGEQD